MWIGNIDEMYIFSYCQNYQMKCNMANSDFQFNLKINVFQKTEFKNF